jgi:hypothetical protein
MPLRVLLRGTRRRGAAARFAGLALRVGQEEGVVVEGVRPLLHVFGRAVDVAK